MTLTETFPNLLVLIGQTAVGKTSLSLKLASQFEGEIISADSRLFYRGMDIGTAKPSVMEQGDIPHHLIDVCNPDETLTLAEYQRRVYKTIDAVVANGRLPILVGGTGQYVKAVVEGWGIPEVVPHPELRAALEALGREELARWLRRLDPIAAERIDSRNVRRVIRALEVTLVAGQPISTLQRKNPPPYRIATLGLDRDRDHLYQRIDLRVDQMIEHGLVAEIKGLRDAGYGRSLPAMSGLGYKQLWAYLDGEMSLDAAIERIKFETHRFARQQNTWFRRDAEKVQWFDMGDAGVETAVLAFVQEWLNG
ncbi:MAG: tRNA (adenosine(37)-N6)-dimethylallyltransferase MiaA [Chloroflexi bacterium]|nr:tRNA (adenosine(37)-N6)-dimethylallyltransferase MiaA [Chloroflexota bacterium]